MENKNKTVFFLLSAVASGILGGVGLLFCLNEHLYCAAFTIAASSAAAFIAGQKIGYKTTYGINR